MAGEWVFFAFFFLFSLIVFLIRRGDKKAHQQRLEILREKIEKREQAAKVEEVSS